MNIKFIIIILSHLYFNATGMLSQEEECVQVIRNDIRQISNMYTPDESQAFYFESTSTMNSREQVPHNNVPIRTQMYMDRTKSWMKNKFVEMYKDKNDAFVVLHSRKTILWTDGTQDVDIESMKNIAFMRDTLFDMSTIASCQKIQDSNGSKILKLVMQPNSQAQDLFHIIQISYTYNLSKKMITHISTQYTSDVSIINMEQEIHSIQTDYKNKLKGPVRKFIVNKDGGLLPKYNGYTLISE